MRLLAAAVFLLTAAAACLSGVVAQFSSLDANCSFSSFSTRVQVKNWHEQTPAPPCMAARM